MGSLREQIAVRGRPAEARAEPPIIERVRQGAWLRVSAVCPATGAEGRAIGPAHAAAALEQLALRRLRSGR